MCALINRILRRKANPFHLYSQQCLKIRHYSSNDLVGTVNYHTQHLGLLTKEISWPVKFFDTTAFHLSLFKQLKEQSPDLFSSIKLTNIYCPSLSSALIDKNKSDSVDTNIIVFPLGLIFYQINIGNLASFVGFLKEFSLKEFSSVEALAWINKRTELRASLLETKYQLVVCTHNEVDCRCGTIGSAIYNKLFDFSRKEIDFLPFKSSHLGGHKYAGNVIVYPQGDWYGNIDTDNLSTLIEHIKKDEIWQLNWRGRIGMDKETQITFLADF